MAFPTHIFSIIVIYQLLLLLPHFIILFNSSTFPIRAAQKYAALLAATEMCIINILYNSIKLLFVKGIFSIQVSAEENLRKFRSN